MTSRERIEAAFGKKATDRIPVNHRGFSSRAASLVLGREAFVGGGIQYWREATSLFEGWHEEFLERSFRDAIDLAMATGQDMIRPAYWRYNHKPTRKLDEHTYLFEEGAEDEWQVMRFHPAIEQTGIFPYRQRKPDPDTARKQVAAGEKAVAGYKPTVEMFPDHIRAQKLYGKDYVIEAHGVGVGIGQAGLWLEALLTDPGLVRARIAQQVEYARRNVAFLSGLGFRFFLGGGDFASDAGPLYSPRSFRELILPGIKEVSEICHDAGGYHLFASDGNLWPVADALFGESGIDGYFEIDLKAGMVLSELRKRFPGLTLIGNISSWTLSRGTSDDVTREVLSCLETAKKYNGVVAGISNYVPPEAPPANVHAMLETLQHNR